MTNDIFILEATTTTAPETSNINNILQNTKLHHIFIATHNIYLFLMVICLAQTDAETDVIDDLTEAGRSQYDAIPWGLFTTILYP